MKISVVPVVPLQMCLISSLDYDKVILYEPAHDKTNKMTCAPSEDSDQPGHPPSLIRVFAMCLMGS